MSKTLRVVSLLTKASVKSNRFIRCGSCLTGILRYRVLKNKRGLSPVSPQFPTVSQFLAQFLAETNIHRIPGELEPEQAVQHYAVANRGQTTF